MAILSNKRLIGIILLAVGVTLLIIGINELGTFSSKISRSFGKSINVQTLSMLIGGGVCTLLGIVRLR